jgi:DNA-binding GntR family transcriptional regulator
MELFMKKILSNTKEIKVKPKKLKEKAYNKIKNMILNLELHPGQIVTESNLSQTLNISRTPIREILKDLEQEGLIITKNRKKIVYELTIKEVEEIFDMKKIIEGNIVKWAAERGKEEDFLKLKKILIEIQQVFIDKSENNYTTELINSWIEMDKKLHSLFFKMASNNKAEEIIAKLNTQWYRLKVGILAIEGRIEKAILEHQLITKAIIEKDAELAKNLMQSHLENLKVVLINIMRIFYYSNSSIKILKNI